MCLSYEHLVHEAKQSGIHRIVVGAVIFNTEQNVLILTRQPNDFMGGIDELPSGKVDQGETLLEALKREVKEESNLEIEVIAYVDYFDYSSKSGNLTRQFNFAANAKSFDVVLNPEEHDGYHWISPKEPISPKITLPVQHAIKSALALI